MTRGSAKQAGLQVARRIQAIRRGMELMPKDAKNVKQIERGTGLEFKYTNDVGLEMTVFSPFVPRKLKLIWR